MFKIISGTEKYINTTGYIKVNANNNIRHVKVYFI